MLILGIESSCDETAASVSRDGREILSNVVLSQADMHALYGGVVPEIASRRHVEGICAVVEKALADAGVTLSDLGAVAVTYAPGLIGALLVGVNYAKGLAFSSGLPLVPVHHIQGHISANYIAFPELAPPFCCLVASGGHSLIVDVQEEELDDEIEKLIEERQAARKARDFARADQIRDELLARGIILEDTREGVKWKRA